MQVTTEQIDPCKIALTISIDPSQVDAARDRAFRQFSQNIQLPGFRKGKVPPHMAKNYIDPNRVKQRAAEILVEPAYQDAVKESGVEPFAEPELEMVEMEDNGPFVFKAYVPLRPTVTLGLYKSLSMDRLRPQVTEADVDRQIDDLLARHAEYPEVTDRTVQTGDILRVALQVHVDDVDIPSLAEPQDATLEVGRNIADLDNGLVGMALDETKTIEAIYPDDYADRRLTGKRATFTILLKEIREKRMPELTDETVSRYHSGVSTVAELREHFRGLLEASADQAADNDLEFRLVAEIANGSHVYFPEVLLRGEMRAIAAQLEENLKRDRVSLEDYLEQQGKEQKDLEADIRGAAEMRLRTSLVLAEVGRKETIEPEDADIDKVIQERADRAKVSTAAVRAFAEKNGQIDQIRDQAMTRKIVDYLKSVSKITERSVTQAELEANTANAAAEIAQIRDVAEGEALAEETSAETKVEEPASEAQAEEPAAEA